MVTCSSLELYEGYAKQVTLYFCFPVSGSALPSLLTSSVWGPWMQVIYLILTQCPFLTSGFQVYLEGTGFLHKIFPPDFYLCLLLAYSFQASLVAQTVKNLPANAGDPGSITESGRYLREGNGNPLQYSCLKIPWTEEPGGLQSMGVTKSQIWLSN